MSFSSVLVLHYQRLKYHPSFIHLWRPWCLTTPWCSKHLTVGTPVTPARKFSHCSIGSHSFNFSGAINHRWQKKLGLKIIPINWNEYSSATLQPVLPVRMELSGNSINIHSRRTAPQRAMNKEHLSFWNRLLVDLPEVRPPPWSVGSAL